jgi:polar amino acid transport system substrate-binding protein
MNNWNRISKLLIVVIFVIGVLGSQFYLSVKINSQEIGVEQTSSQTNSQSSSQNSEQSPTPESTIPKNPKLKVATKLAPPMVLDKAGNLEGFSIDLWQEISKRINLESEFEIKNNVKEILDSTISKEVDLGIAAISQTSDREKIVDFSQPYLNAGLKILIRSDQTNLVQQSIVFLRSGAMKLLYFGILVIVILGNLHYFWNLIRRKKSSGNYFKDVWDNIWWLFNGLFRSEFSVDQNRMHQITTAFMIIASIIFVTQFQAMVTSDLTLDQIDSKIASVNDLKGKKIGVVKNTTAQKYSDENQLNAALFSSNDELLANLISQKVDAVILDAPIAKYYANNEGKGKVTESITLNREHYSIAFPIGSPLRKGINEAILGIEQDGTMSTLTQKWFGEE